MDLFEYQAKRLFYEMGIPTPPARLALDVDEALEVVDEWQLPLVVKAQVLSGGRGKAGTVVIVNDRAAFKQAAEQMFWITDEDRPVSHVLVERMVAVEHEFYLAVALDRHLRQWVLLFSNYGGVDVEHSLRAGPERLVSLPIDPLKGLKASQVELIIAEAAKVVPITDALRRDFVLIVSAVARLAHDDEATLVEINPLALAHDGRLIALDGKVDLDDNALGRHPELALLQTFAGERERRAHVAGLPYLSLQGDIGVIGSGAGHLMSTIDMIAAAGGRAADFCDIGGGARAGAIRTAFSVITSDERVKCILVNIFGGITRGDEMARGILEGVTAATRKMPVIVRIDGNDAQAALDLLTAEEIPRLTIIANVDDAIAAVVAAAAGA